MHHDYPLPPEGIEDLIEEWRRAERSEESIAAELAERGIAEAEIAAYLAPGATVVAIAESSVEMIEHYTPGQVWAFGIVFGFPAALMMIRSNSVWLRGQDRMTARSAKYAVAYGLAVAAVALAFVAIALAGQAVPPLAVGAALFTVSAAFTAYAATVSVRAQKPFHEDAASRDEIAPASVAFPILAGVGHDLVAYLLLPYLITLIS